MQKIHYRDYSAEIYKAYDKLILEAINRQTEVMHKDNEEIKALLRQLVNKDKVFKDRRWQEFLDLVSTRKVVHTDTVIRKLKVSRATALKYMRRFVDLSEEWKEEHTNYGIRIIRTKA